MKHFTVHRLSFFAGVSTEKEEAIHADYYEVHDGVLTFYKRSSLVGTPEKVAAYAVAVLVKVGEGKEDEATP